MTTDQTVQEVIEKVKAAARSVWNDLKIGWAEAIYQKAMEIALRERGVVFESQRIVPVFYKENNREYCVGEGIPDLIVWTESGTKRTAVVVDLKTDQYLKEDHARQVQKYIEALDKQRKENEEVHPAGLIINFPKGGTKKIAKESLAEQEGPEILLIDKSKDISLMIEKKKPKEEEE